MNAGRSLQSLAIEIERQQLAKRDFLASTDQLEMHSNGKSSLYVGSFDQAFTVQPIAHSQIAQHLSIPKAYYDRLQKDHPGLLDTNVNQLFRAQPARRLIRTLDGNARALLSDRYRALDNFDLAEHILPVIDDMRLQPVSLELTERKLYLKLFSQNLMADIKVGDPVRMGLMISNSEVGLGSLNIQPMTERLVCENGMVVTDYAKRSYHVGRLNEAEGEAREFFRDETRRADDRAFWMKAIDTLRGVFSEVIFGQIVDRMRAATERKIEGDPIRAVEITGQRFGFGQETQASVLRHLINGGDLSQYGLMNAVTRAAQDETSYDSATEMEVAGGQIIEMKPSEWRVISTANRK